MSRQTLQHALVPVESKVGKDMGKGVWIQLESVLYKDNKDVERQWERCIRRKERPSDIDGKLHNDTILAVESK